MATFNYKLRANTIVIIFNYGKGNRFRTTTGYKVSKVSNWLDSQNIKNVIDENNVNGQYSALQINNKLSLIKDSFLAEFDLLVEQGEVITNELLNDCVQRLRTNTQPKNTQTKQLGFFEYFDLFINDSETGKRRNKRNKSLITKGTIKTYYTTKVFLKDFVKDRKKPIYFSQIDVNLYNEINDYADTKRELSLNYKGKHIKVLRTFLEYVTSEYDVKVIKYKSNDFLVEREVIDEIALSIGELDVMFNLDLSNNDLHSRARDLFLIGAYTGLRVSDFGALTIHNIVDIDGVECFQTHIEKTNSDILIPLSSKVKEIIKRNDGLPKRMLAQQINDNIKTVGELAMFNDEVNITKTIGGKKITKTFFKYELIKSHSARRSFCTNAYLNGVDSITIMSISGHKTESNFLTYIKVPPKEHAKRLANHSFFKMM